MKPFTFLATVIPSFLAGFFAGLAGEYLGEQFGRAKDFCKAAKDLAEQRNSQGTPTPPTP